MSKSTTRTPQPMEQLEDRRLMAASSLKMAGNDLQNIAVPNNSVAKANANDLIITFTGKIDDDVDTSKIRLFAYAADTTNTTNQDKQIKKTIPITSTRLDSTGTKLIIRTGMLVRKGAPIELETGSVKDTSGNDITGTAEAKKGVNKARFTLAARAFKVTDKSYFSSEILTGGRTAVSTGNSELNEDTVEAELDALLSKKVRQGVITSAKKTETMAKFNASATKSVASSANIRAAILSLVGTVGEPAIAYYFDKGNATGNNPIALRFDNEFDTSARIVASSFNTSGRLRVILNPQYVGESFVVLGSILAKEAFQDTVDPDDDRRTYLSQDELVISNFAEASVYAQQLIADSNYSKKGTALTLRANHRLLLALNSGTQQFPRVGIKAAPLLGGTNAAPGFNTSSIYGNTYGGATVRSYEEDIRDEYNSRSIGVKPAWNMKATARAIVSNITGDTLTSSAQFSTAMITQIDQNQDVFGDTDVMKLAKAIMVKI